MKNRDRLIIGLLAVGVIFFAAIQFVIIPHNNANEKAYAAAQQEPATHDLSSILPYKSRYMGDASNDANLFYHLPLCNIGMSFGVDSTNYRLEVDYKETVENIGEEKVQSALLYNSTAAFALISNLNAIEYNFTGASYEVKRTDIEALYSGFGTVLQKSNWKTSVQDKMNDVAYVNETFQKVFREKAF